jgi:hypothetical protein
MTVGNLTVGNTNENWKYQSTSKCSTVVQPGLPDFSWYNIPEREKDLPDHHKLYQMAKKYTK